MSDGPPGRTDGASRSHGAPGSKTRPKLYPAPVYVQTATRSLIEKGIVDFTAALTSTNTKDSAFLWDQFKAQIRDSMRRLKLEARGRMNRGYRQRIQRHKQQLAKWADGTPQGEAERANIVEALHQVQETRRRLKRRIVIAQNAWSSKASTKAFFRRVCTKFTDNTTRP
jgi:hypothetical protein